ncbi:helix-turn-helix transcriptional regulator [Nakamurella alba]|uniref:helix-turn-helix transcriptional regulator n=1 Tax=Nakamurella alba TaxID=2665158 RepID=UPI0018A96FEE|nr:LuxR C-terminal-related transcriptional regulator [Nakamurella alba]
MVGPHDLSAKDVGSLLGLLRPGGDEVQPHAPDPDDPAPALPWPVLWDMLALVPCDEIGLCELDHPGRTRLVQQAVVEGVQDLVHGVPDEPAVQVFFDTGLCRPGLPIEARRRSARMTRRQAREDPLLQAADLWDYADELVVEMPAPTGITRRLLVRRYDGPDFTDRDVLVMELLRLRIQELYRHTRRQHLLPLLTSRQWEVMSLIAQGIPTAGIAKTLFTSESTVRKHVENILLRLDVRSREAAVAAVMPALDGSVGAYRIPVQSTRTPTGLSR